MKLNKFAIIAVTLFAMGSTRAFAADSKSDTPKTECSKNNECYNGKKCVSECVPGRCAKDANCVPKSECRAAGASCQFAGLDLTDAQRESLQKINSECRQAKVSEKQQRRAAATNDRSAYLAKVKEILTPEQYVKFLENSFVNAKRRAGRDFGKGKTDVCRRFDKTAHDRTPRREAPKAEKITE